jgi:hypothetical protein
VELPLSCVLLSERDLASPPVQEYGEENVMNKKVAKKLVLNRETLRELTENQLGKIGGGIGPSDLREDSCVKTCWCDTTK